ncbi:hypothetical protein K474DRAFT_181247 [Panus rudis PR-1116 ss-1]|nr:hypothetical protein K474DRAFT_181247 [Panus rudis PR-1116 ss-1]
MPTHILAVSESTPSQGSRQATSSTSTRSAGPPIPLPINVDLLRDRFSHDLSHLFPSGSRSTTQVPASYWDERTKRMMISVPVVPFCAPHPASMSLLLLFGMGLHTYSDRDRNEVAEESDVSDSTSTSTSASTSASTASSVPSSSSASSESESETSSPDSPYPMGKHTPIGLLATYLLPTPVIEEFPATSTMAETMVRHCPPEEIHSYAEFNAGLWRNTLQLAPRSEDVMDIVRTAMNVSMMAKRMAGLAQGQRQVQRATSMVSLGPGGSTSATRQVDPRDAPRPSRQR